MPSGARTRLRPHRSPQWRETPAMTDAHADPRLDPRLAAVLALIPSGPTPDIDSREALLAEVNAPEARAAYDAAIGAMNLLDDDTVAPRHGLAVTEHEFT